MNCRLSCGFAMVAYFTTLCGCALSNHEVMQPPPQPAALKFTVQPSSTPVSAAIAPAVAVQALDSTGHGVAAVAVSLSIGTNSPAIGHSDWPGTGTLTGTLTRKTDATGIATFNDLKIDFVGDDYTLVATVSAASGDIQAVTAPFAEQRVNACLGPAAPACSSGCPDSDGDGLNDAWKLAGGIDFNGDGVVSPGEKVLTNFDPLLPDGSPNPHPSAEGGRKDVFLRYDSMQVTGSGAACVTASDCGGHCSDTWAACGTSADCATSATCMSDQYCVGQCSVRTSIACNTAFDCGGSCSVTAGMFCEVDQDCPGGETCVASGEQCLNTICRGHDDAPTPAALIQVIQAFDAHGITLHISPEHHVVPHSHVTSYGPPIDGCATPAGHVNDTGRAVDFYSLKPAEATGGGSQRPFIHYALFGHLHTCDSPAECSVTCPPNPETGIRPKFRESGLSEIVGNDMILAFGAQFDGSAGRKGPSDLSMAGTFMHELGHNLGLDHGGPYYSVDHQLNYKPNYLSVMNYSFQVVGIGTAAEPGSIVPMSKRIDYSGAALAPLNENDLNETIGINSGTNDITTFFCPATTHAPGTGPIDWDCNGDGGTETRSGTAAGSIYVEINNNSTDDSFMGGYADWPNLNFAFQCDANGHYGDGAAVAGITSLELDPETAAAQHVLLPTKVAAISVGAACSSNNDAATSRPSGTVTVALFGASDFAVSEVNLSSLRFHHATPVTTSFADVNGDSIPDLVLEFRLSEAKVPTAATRVHLTGWLRNSQAFVGEVDAGAVRGAAAPAAQCAPGARQ
ncbi:MAG TPA: hypothetical protein VMI93_02645 [Candidatus Solibacter sp.]|nr:hypothetical protein [Candidatus Solibacter sp.]